MKLIDAGYGLKDLIDNNGSTLVKNVKATRFSLEGDFYVFSFGSHYTFYNRQGVKLLHNDKLKISAYRIDGDLLAYKKSTRNYGLVDSRGIEILENKYTKIEFFSGLICTHRATKLIIYDRYGKELLKTHKSRFYEENGRLIVEILNNGYAEYISYDPISNSFSDSIAIPNKSIWHGNCYWFADSYGYYNEDSYTLTVWQNGGNTLGSTIFSSAEKFNRFEKTQSGFMVITVIYSITPNTDEVREYQFDNNFNQIGPASITLVKR